MSIQFYKHRKEDLWFFHNESDGSTIVGEYVASIIPMGSIAEPSDDIDYLQDTLPVEQSEVPEEIVQGMLDADDLRILE